MGCPQIEFVEKSRIEHLYRDPHLTDVPLFLEYGDLADASSLRHVLTKVQPDEVYNLAAQSHVRISFDQANIPLMFPQRASSGS